MAAAEQIPLGRRGLLCLAGAGAGLALLPVAARAQSAAPASKGYRAMLLSCVDPRIQAPVAAWMDAPVPASHTISLEGKYSQFTIAGATVGVVAPAFVGWDKTFWDNLAASVQLHGIASLIAVGHADCGAVGLAYGARVQADPVLEQHAQANDARRLREELSWRHPDLDMQAWLLGRNEQGRFADWKNLVEGPVIG